MAGQSARLSFDGKRAVVLRDGKVTIVPLAGQPRELTTPSQATDMLAWDGSTHVVYAAEDGGIYRQDAEVMARPPSCAMPLSRRPGRVCSWPPRLF